MENFKIGDRVIRTGPHYIYLSTRDFGERECKVGDVGTVTRLYLDGDVSVKWDHGRSSSIVPTSLRIFSGVEAEIDSLKARKKKLESLVTLAKELGYDLVKKAV